MEIVAGVLSLVGWSTCRYRTPPGTTAANVFDLCWSLTVSHSSFGMLMIGLPPFAPLIGGPSFATAVKLHEVRTGSR